MFGATGAGKTSFLNGITGQNFATNNNVKGCTFKSTFYPPVQFTDGNHYEFIDTMGLNEGTKGTVEAKDAIKALFNLIFENSKGFSLLIMVIKADRVDAAIEKNYRLFVTELVEGKVPVILIITKCDLGPSGGVILDLNKWLFLNKKHIDTYGFRCKAIVSTSWASSDNPKYEEDYRELREISKKRVIECIMSNSLNNNISFDRKGIATTFRRVWNFIAFIYNLPEWIGKLGEILMSIGFTKTEAAQMESAINYGEIVQYFKDMFQQKSSSAITDASGAPAPMEKSKLP